MWKPCNRKSLAEALPKHSYCTSNMLFYRVSILKHILRVQCNKRPRISFGRASASHCHLHPTNAASHVCPDMFLNLLCQASRGLEQPMNGEAQRFRIGALPQSQGPVGMLWLLVDIVRGQLEHSSYQYPAWNRYPLLQSEVLKHCIWTGASAMNCRAVAAWINPSMENLKKHREAPMGPSLNLKRQLACRGF